MSEKTTVTLALLLALGLVFDLAVIPFLRAKLDRRRQNREVAALIGKIQDRHAAFDAEFEEARNRIREDIHRGSRRTSGKLVRPCDGSGRGRA